MKQLFRLLKVLIFSRFRSALDVLDEGVVTFRVWPNDLDPLLHMNNGVYLTLLDLGRIDLTIRSGLFKKINELGIYAVVASEACKFRKSLGPFSKFSIKTKTIYWDDKYFFMQQHFVQNGEVAASAIVKARFLKKTGGGVAPADILEAMNRPHLPPERPELVARFLEMDSLLR